MARTGRPPKYKTALELQTIIQAYWKECDPHIETYTDWEVIRSKNGGTRQIEVKRKRRTEQQPYTMSGLARRLGLSRQALMEYKKERGDEIGDTIKEARSIVEEFNERYLLGGRNVAGAIFNLKVNFGFKENIEENPPPENPIVFINNVLVSPEQPEPEAPQTKPAVS